jgi:hypothetical protein
MIQDLKLLLLCRALPAWIWFDFLLLPSARLSQLLEQNSELFLGQLRHALEEGQLIVEVVVGTIEPESKIAFSQSPLPFPYSTA